MRLEARDERCYIGRRGTRALGAHHETRALGGTRGHKKRARGGRGVRERRVHDTMRLPDDPTPVINQVIN